MREKRRLIETVCVLSSWAYRMSETGPASYRGRFLTVMDQANKFTFRLEEHLDFLKEHGRTQKGAVLEMRRALFRGHENFYLDEPNRNNILRLCLDLGLRAPPGWHGHFMFSNQRYKSIVSGKSE